MQVRRGILRFAQNDRQVLFKNVVRGFSLVHDPKGSHYENRGGERLLKVDKANLVLNLGQN